jgi:hypothetical protein
MAISITNMGAHRQDVDSFKAQELQREHLLNWDLCKKPTVSSSLSPCY